MHIIQAWQTEQALPKKIQISTYFKISDLWLIVGVSQIITAVSFWLTRSQDEPDGQFEARVTHSAHYPVSSKTSNHNHVLRDPPDAPDVDTLTRWHQSWVLTHQASFVVEFLVSAYKICFDFGRPTSARSLRLMSSHWGWLSRNLAFSLFSGESATSHFQLDFCYEFWRGSRRQI